MSLNPIITATGCHFTDPIVLRHKVSLVLPLILSLVYTCSSENTSHFAHFTTS